jgi:hypothetical protein
MFVMCVAGSLTFNGQIGCNPIKCTSSSSEQENSVSQWVFKLKSALATAENWHSKGCALKLMAMQQVKGCKEYHSVTAITLYSHIGARRLAMVTTVFVILQSLCHDNISKHSLAASASLHILLNSLLIMTACMKLQICH